MSPSAVIAIVIGVVVVLGAVVLVTASRRSDVRGAGALSRETKRRDRDAEIDLPQGLTGREVERAAVEQRSTSLVKADNMAPAVWVPPDPEALGVSRRQFFNRASIALTGASLLTFAAASFVAFLWPFATGGFGGKVRVGKRDEILGSIRSSGGFFYAPEARSWITEYPSTALPKAVAAYEPVILAGLEAGLVALYQKCPHLGCRVPSCVSSQWFECPCHGSQYNRVGEKKAGPAPRGMDHFAISVSGSGDVVIDTGTVYAGVPIGTNTSGQEAEGPNCV
ncbi:MAG: Rieske 2Fe-2S domain-containing protein [Ilumatobacteraceae bacterium]